MDYYIMKNIGTGPYFCGGPITWLGKGVGLFQRQSLSIGIEPISLESNYLNIQKRLRLFTRQMRTLFDGINSSRKQEIS